jgi:hypothetical protein
LESPTVPLDDVFFPSVVVCNMNSARKSFIHSLMTDPILAELTSLQELTTLFNEVYVVGSKTTLSTKEQTIVDSNILST